MYSSSNEMVRSNVLFYVNALYVSAYNLLLFLFYSTKNQRNTIPQTIRAIIVMRKNRLKIQKKIRTNKKPYRFPNMRSARRKHTKVNNT